MALLGKLFQQHRGKNQRSSTTKWYGTELSKEWESHPFEKHQIRLVLFRDHDMRGRHLLYDSKIVKPAKDVKEHCKLLRHKKTELITCKGGVNSKGDDKDNTYQGHRKGSDSKLLEEMIFGNTPMSLKSTTLKVHAIRTPPQLMVSTMFILNRPTRESAGDSDNYDNCSLHSSTSELTAPKDISGSISKDSPSIARSIPVDVPSPPNQPMHKDDSGIVTSLASSGSWTTPFPSPGSSSSLGSLGSNGYNSLQRRWIRSHAMALEFGIRKRNSGDVLPGTSDSLPSQKKCKLGIGILFNLFPEQDEANNRHFQSFFFSHITLFENHVYELRVAIEKSCRHKNYKDRIHEAFEKFQDQIYDLYTAPRLNEPVWLNMVACNAHTHAVVCHHFLKEFMTSVEKFDTKTTNFFVSSLVTAVLSNHLAWVPTVTPAGATPARNYLDKHSAKWLDALAKSHPYNPLWAQLGDLYGAITFPMKLSRTLVVGKKTELVQKFLFILSYFIRCSEVNEIFQEKDKSNQDLDVCDDDLEEGYSSMPPITEGSLSSRANSFSADENMDIKLEDNYKSCNVSMQLRNASDIGADSSKPKRPDSLHISGKPELKEQLQSNRGSLHEETSAKVAALCRTLQDSNKKMARTLLNGELTPAQLRSDIRPVSLDSCRDSAISTFSALSETDEGSVMMMNSESDASCRDSAICTHYDINGSVEDVSIKELREKDCEYEEGLQSKTQLTVNVDNETETTDNKSEEFTCRLSPDQGVERRVENIRHVGRVSLEKVQELQILDTPPSKDCDWAGNDCVEKSKNGALFKPQVFFRLPSLESGSSMFDEYFNEDAHVKTIDEVQEHELVTVLQSSGSDSTLKPSQSRNNFSYIHDAVDSESTLKSTQLSNNISESLVASMDSAFDDSSLKCETQTDQPLPTDDCALDNDYDSPKDFRQRVSSLGKRERLSCSSDRSDTTVTEEIRSRHPSFSRQPSRSITPSRCRSITPEFGRQRHISGASVNDEDPFLFMKEMNMPKSKTAPKTPVENNYERNFGHSLLGGYTSHYLSDFVLHGTSDMKFSKKLEEDLSISVQHSVLDEPISESVCVVANLEKWSVELWSSTRLLAGKPPQCTITPSQLVINMIESIQELWRLDISPEFCLMHLEDQLQEVYFKSKMLAEYLSCEKKASAKEITAALGLDPSDLPLLIAVAAIHSPHQGLGIV